MQFQILIFLVQCLFGLLALSISIHRCRNFQLEGAAAGFLAGIHFALILLLFYAHLHWLIPRFLERKKYWAYRLGLIAVPLGLIAVGQLADWIIFTSFRTQWPGFFQFTAVREVFLTHAVVILLAFPFKLAEQWFRNRKLEQMIHTDRQVAELSFLKAQINPHFLLNVLNNAYSLTIMEAPEAGPTIKKLSAMMNYMLLECRNAKVPIVQELNYLDNFLELHQLRKDGQLRIVFERRGPLENVVIEPMLFIPFFENAFKHGNLEDLQQGYLNSYIVLEGGQLSFRLENSIGAKPRDHKGGGIGIHNIRQRLQLLYPHRHRLSLEKDENRFTVEMQLELLPHLNKH